MRRILISLGFDIKVMAPNQPMFSGALGFRKRLGRRIDSARIKGTDSLDGEKQNITRFARAEERFRHELPELLKHEENCGKWVLFSSEGQIDESGDDLDLHSKYGKSIGDRYFLGRVVPEPPIAEMTPNWFVRFDKSKSGQETKRGR